MITARTLESCLELLIPTPEGFFIPEIEDDVPSRSTEFSLTGQKGDDDNSDDENTRRRETGIIDPVAHAVTITLKPGDYNIFDCYCVFSLKSISLTSNR